MPGANKAAVRAALSTVAEDIGGLGLVFLFQSHDALHMAKKTLGNPDTPGTLLSSDFVYFVVIRFYTIYIILYGSLH